MTAASTGTWIDFHGIAIELAYASLPDDAFATLFAPFPRTTSREGGLHIELAATNVPCNKPSSAFRPCFFYGVVQAYTQDELYLLHDGRSSIEIEPRAGTMRGLLFRPDTAGVSAGMQHIALSLLLRERGIFDAHAAVACDSERAFLLLGDSGSGKTTALLGLMAAGFQFLGDDRVLLRPRYGFPELLAYPREFHVAPQTLAATSSSPAAKTGLYPDGRYRIAPLEWWPSSYRDTWRGQLVLLFPEIVRDAASSIASVSPAESFGKLLASSAMVALTSVRHTAEQLTVLKELADSAPAWTLRLGTDALGSTGSVLKHLLDDARF